MSHDAGEPHPSPAQRLRRLLAIERSDLLVIVGYAVAIGLLSLATPVAAQVLVNQIAFTALLQPVVIMMLLVLIGWGLSGILRALQHSVVELLQQRLFVRSAADLARRLPALAVSALERAPGAALVTRFLDVVSLQKAAAGLLLDALAIVLQSVLGLLVLAFYHPLLLAFDVVLIACIVLIVWGLGRGGVATSIDESRSKFAVADWLLEVARHPRLFHSDPAAAHARARMDALLGSYLVARRRHFRVVLRQLGGSLALQALGSAALLGLGGALVIAGQLTVGQLVAAEIIVSSVVAGVAKLGKQLESYYDLMAALDKLGHLEDLPVERSGGTTLPAAPSGIAVRLHAVTAGYHPEQPLLREASLSLRAGEHVMVSGGRGSGKSLLCDLLFGLRAPARGLIEIDGHDLRGLDLQELRAQIALLRSPEIFTGSFAENLQIARRDVRPTELRAALQSVGLWDELVTTPEGLEAQLASDAQALSEAQRRRLLVARALLQRPRLILIDDELALDAAALAPLLRRDAPWTVLLCAPAFDAGSQLFDRRYWLVDGRLCAEPGEAADAGERPARPQAADGGAVEIQS